MNANTVTGIKRRKISAAVAAMGIDRSRARMLSGVIFAGLITAQAGAALACDTGIGFVDVVCNGLGDFIEGGIDTIEGIATSLWDDTTGPRCYAEVIANPLETQLYADILAAKSAGLLKSRAECEDRAKLAAALASPAVAALGGSGDASNYIGTEGGDCACFLAFGPGSVSPSNYNPPPTDPTVINPPSITGSNQAPCTPDDFEPVTGPAEATELLGVWADGQYSTGATISLSVLDYGAVDANGYPLVSAVLTENPLRPGCFAPDNGVTNSASLKGVALPDNYTYNTYDPTCYGAGGAKMIVPLVGTTAATSAGTAKLVSPFIAGTTTRTTAIALAGPAPVATTIKLSGTAPVATTIALTPPPTFNSTVTPPPATSSTPIAQSVTPVFVKAVANMPFNTTAFLYKTYDNSTGEHNFCGDRLRYVRMNGTRVMTDVMLAPAIPAPR